MSTLPTVTIGGQGRENLERAYLSGRYGALPFIRDLDNS